jgi:hypothetical protein
LTTVAGESESRQALLSVVGGFETVGESLILQKEIPYPPSIRNNAKNLTNLINGNITEIVFQTANVDYVITAASLAGEEEPQKIYAYGAIKGWIQTLSMRRGLKFTLYDALYDKGVACYLKQGQEELVRNAWGYKTLVSGYITRDSTGKPLSIRDISTIEILPESDPEAWKRAAGVFPRGDEPAEVAVRRIRDA